MLHPINILYKIIPKVDKYTFSWYTYHKYDTLVEQGDRVLAYCNSMDEVQSLLHEGYNSTKKDLALHSNVTINNEIYHIPMIDFKIKVSDDNTELIYNSLFDVIPEQIVSNFILFNSGNSYHGYSSEVLPENEWVQFMGLLCLLEDIVNIRWVGHRLIAGYSTLRWTKNDFKYKKLPTLIPHEFQ